MSNEKKKRKSQTKNTYGSDAFDCGLMGTIFRSFFAEISRSSWQPLGVDSAARLRV